MKLRFRQSAAREPPASVQEPEYSRLLRILAAGCKNHAPPIFRKISDSEYAYNHIIELDYASSPFGRPLNNSKIGDLIESLRARGCIDVASTENSIKLTETSADLLTRPVYGGFLGETPPDRVLVLKHQA
jgi:hypothetical protein